MRGKNTIRELEDRLRVLSDVMRAFADASTDLERLLEVIATRVSGVVADSCSVLLVGDDGQTVTLGAMAAVNAEITARTTSLLAEYPFKLTDVPVFDRLISTNTPLCVPRMSSPEVRERFPKEYIDAVDAAGIHSMLLVPLRAHGVAVGALVLARCLEDTAPFDENDVELAKNLADHAALAISNARSLAAARESSQLHGLVFDTSPAPMMIHDVASLRILAANAAACALYGFDCEQLLSLSIDDLRSAGDPPDETTRRQAASDLDVRSTRQHQRKDGSLITIEGTSRPILFRGRRARLAIFADVTQQERHQEELRQMQKMDAIGVLAGGIAHDFNNVLSVVLSYADLIREQLREEDPIRDDVEEIRLAAQHAADLARQLLMFSSKQVLAPRVLDPNELLSSVDRMARRIVGEDVELVSLLTPDVGHIRVDPGSFERVVVNLVVNARDALRVGGKITMKTANVERSGESFVALSVTDNGVGMTDATRARIFEPFFTTKERGRGTGLGLSTVFGIMQQSSGTVEVTSELGVGSTFTLFLPRVDDALSTPSGATGARGVARGWETILLVEDEDQVRAVARSILAQRGYEVLDARDPAEATRLCAEHGRPIHLLLTDVVLPQMGGPELAKRLRATRSDMKVLFMSGYTDDAVVRRGVLQGSVAFVQKPFTMELLTAKVRAVLDG